MTISLIVAYAKNRVIGRDNDIPWHLPDDLRYFKKVTTGHHIIMGRKTFDSIGRPLPKRTNMVLTRQLNWQQQGIEIFADLQQAIDFARGRGEDECCIIGGGQIYQIALPLAHKVYATEVDAVVEGQVLFPALDQADWQEQLREHHPADEKHFAGFDFVEYLKVSK